MAFPLLLAVAALAQTGGQEYQEPEPEINWTTNTDAKTYYNSRLRIARLLMTPEWKPGQDNPPLSARRAIALASATIEKLAPYGKDAKLAGPSLGLRESSGHWYWVVFFSPNDWRRFQSTFPIVVLMDGTVVEPRLIPPPPARLGDE